MFCSLHCSLPLAGQDTSLYGLWTDVMTILTSLHAWRINLPSLGISEFLSKFKCTMPCAHKPICPLLPALLIIVTTAISKHKPWTADWPCTQKHSSGFSSPPLWELQQKASHKYHYLFLLRASKTLWWATHGKKESSIAAEQQTG